MLRVALSRKTSVVYRGAERLQLQMSVGMMPPCNDRALATVGLGSTTLLRLRKGLQYR